MNVEGSLLSDQGQGNPNPSQDPNSGGGNPNPNPDPNVNPGTEQPQSYDWISSLPDDLKNEASLKLIHGKDDKEVLKALAKSYVHSQRHMGADKIPVPTKHATEDDWNQVFKKLGLPDADKYELENLGEGIDKNSEIYKNFKDIAHKAGILPRQAEKVLNWFNDASKAQREKFLESQKTSVNETLDSLKKDWGNAFEGRLKGLQGFVKQYGGEDFVKFLNESGLGNKIEMIKFIDGLKTKFTSEDSINNDGTGSQFMTPNQARDSYNSIMKNPAHPYFNSEHPGHEAAKREVQKLFADAFPS